MGMFVSRCRIFLFEGLRVIAKNDKIVLDKIDANFLLKGSESYLTSDIWHCVDDTSLQIDDHTQKPIIDSDGKTRNVAFDFDISGAYKGLSIESELSIKLYIINKSRL